MNLLLDTQALVWIGDGDRGLTALVRAALADEGNSLFVSAVTSWEFADLENRGRFVPAVSFEPIVDRLGAAILDCRPTCGALPDLHRDPVDRMLIAHAIHADMVLVTADKLMRDYPVRSLW